MHLYTLSWLSLRGNWRPYQKNKVIISRPLIGLLADGIADIPESPRLDDGPVENLSKEKQELYVASARDRHSRLASAFRERMVPGESYKVPNAYREMFYNRVIERAKRVNFLSSLFL